MLKILFNGQALLVVRLPTLGTFTIESSPIVRQSLSLDREQELTLGA